MRCTVTSGGVWRAQFDTSEVQSQHAAAVWAAWRPSGTWSAYCAVPLALRVVLSTAAAPVAAIETGHGPDDVAQNLYLCVCNGATWLQARSGGSAATRLLSAHPCPRRHRMATLPIRAAATVAAPERPPVQPMPKPLVSTLHKLAFDRDSLPSLGVPLARCHNPSTLLPGRACLPIAKAVSCACKHQVVILTLVGCRMQRTRATSRMRSSSSCSSCVRQTWTSSSGAS